MLVQCLSFLGLLSFIRQHHNSKPSNPAVSFLATLSFLHNLAALSLSLSLSLSLYIYIYIYIFPVLIEHIYTDKRKCELPVTNLVACNCFLMPKVEYIEFACSIGKLFNNYDLWAASAVGVIRCVNAVNLQIETVSA
jgi:hypothetical protein